MKEYKTITCEMKYPDAFDYSVNKAVKESWIVTGRQIVRGIDSDYTSIKQPTELVAFLEREITEE